MTDHGGTIRVGVAGWDYPDWRGTVYPKRAGKGFDRLAYVAEFVDVVEINRSFYRPVSRRVAESWVARTRHRTRFRFTAKAHRSWTHESAPDLGAAVRETLSGIRPLRSEGVLAALLVQFPQRFHATPEAFDHLERIAELVRGWPTVVEVRHRSWGDPRAARWFAARGLGWCGVDQPDIGGSTLGVTDTTTAGVAYLRLHGRNSQDWFRRDAGRNARYDYLYTPEELEPLVGFAGRMATTAEEVIVVANNHFRGQALVNALQMKAMLKGRPVAAPRSLVASYPGIDAITRPEPDALF